MNLFELYANSGFNDDVRNGNQNTLLISIAIKQFESANALYTESEKIKSALKSLEERTKNDYATLSEINKNAEEALFSIIMEKASFQAELHKLIE